MHIQQNIEQIESDLKLELGTDMLIIHTHISLILIGSSFTYKIKKAKDLGFLNFETLKSREFFSKEEIRLNKKTAPSIYLQVIPIFLSEGKFSLLPSEDDPIEYAVKMNSFDQGQLLTNCWDTITNQQLEELSVTLADFHQEKSETSAEITNFATFKRLNNIAQSNLLSVKKYVGISIEQSEYDNLETNTLNCFKSKELQDLFNMRRSKNKVRACHGDLHLNNLCLIDNQITPFDCIEFNKEFRYIDTLYDLSFLLMDLSFKGHESQANLILSTYLEKANDYFSTPLLSLYLSMRATIRGKVISMETADLSITKEQRTISKTSAQNYLNFASKALNPVQGKLIIVSGLSGSGKTYLSKKIQEHIPFIHLRSDVIRKLEFEKTENLYNSDISEKTYDLILKHSLNLINSGFNVIVDATFLNTKIRTSFIHQLNLKSIPYKWVYCQQQIETMKDRISNRKNDYSDATVSVLDEQIIKFDKNEFLKTINPQIYVNNEDFKSIITLIKSEQLN